MLLVQQSRRFVPILPESTKMPAQRECVILIGIQGAGKSSFYADHFSDSHIRISHDMLRTKEKEWKLFESCLSCSVSCVVDNINSTKEERKRYIEAAQKNGFFVSGCYLRSDIKECLLRNDQRKQPNKIPHTVIVSRYNKMELPSLSEGFDELRYVSIVDGEFLVEPYSDELVKSPKKEIVTRRVSVPVLDCIDWKRIVQSFAWELGISIEIKEASDTLSPLALLELVGEERYIIEFTNEVYKKISSAIEEVPDIRVFRGYYEIPFWRASCVIPQKMAIDMGIRLNILGTEGGWFKKTVFYEAEGEVGALIDFVEKTNPKASF